MLQEDSILETPGLVFAGITHDVSRVGVGLRCNAPLSANGKPGAAAAPESGGVYFVKNVFADWPVPAGSAVFIEGLAMGRPSFGKKDHDDSF
jgi:hypothetical protein